MKTVSSTVVYLHLLLLYHRALSSSVLAIGASLICGRIQGLAPRQRAICQSHPDSMASVGEGAKIGALECRFQFRKNRWNCSLATGESPLGYASKTGTREVGSFFAFRSAGIAYAVTQACSAGGLIGCGCDRTKRDGAGGAGGGGGRRGGGRGAPGGGGDDWRWGGCSADVSYGLRFARVFLDSKEIEENDRTLANIHNNRVGRKALKDSVSVQCKCHGVSGSCTMKTCWMTLPKFRSVGDRLLGRYLSARQVTALRASTRARRPMFLVLKHSKVPHRKPPVRDVVYLDASPTYCDHNAASESLGTKGRTCNRTVDTGTMNGCDSMCCGRGYNTREENRTWKCNCRFHWCCSVTCHLCSEQVEGFTCK